MPLSPVAEIDIYLDVQEKPTSLRVTTFVTQAFEQGRVIHVLLPTHGYRQSLEDFTINSHRRVHHFFLDLVQ